MIIIENNKAEIYNENIHDLLTDANYLKLTQAEEELNDRSC